MAALVGVALIPIGAASGEPAAIPNELDAIIQSDEIASHNTSDMPRSFRDTMFQSFIVSDKEHSVGRVNFCRSRERLSMSLSMTSGNITQAISFITAGSRENDLNYVKFLLRDKAGILKEEADTLRAKAMKDHIDRVNQFALADISDRIERYRQGSVLALYPMWK